MLGLKNTDNASHSRLAPTFELTPACSAFCSCHDQSYCDCWVVCVRNVCRKRYFAWLWTNNISSSTKSIDLNGKTSRMTNPGSLQLRFKVLLKDLRTDNQQFESTALFHLVSPDALSQDFWYILSRACHCKLPFVLHRWVFVCVNAWVR